MVLLKERLPGKYHLDCKLENPNTSCSHCHLSLQLSIMQTANSQPLVQPFRAVPWMSHASTNTSDPQQRTAQ